MFPDSVVSTLRSYLTRALQSAHDTEFELRFSTFTKDIYQQGRPAVPGQRSSSYRFRPVIDQSTFYKTLATFYTYGLAEQRQQVTDIFYANYVRKTVDYSGNSTWVTKTRSQYTDFHDYNIRASWATEIPHAGLDSSYQPSRVRMKDRVSFIDGCARYDFTTVQTQDLQPGKDSRERTSYEIEIEFLPPQSNNPRTNIKHLDYVMTHIVYCMQQMLLTLQGSADIITLSTRHNVLLEYNTLTRVRHFLGAQPETLHRHHLSQIRTGYSISEKYDGERALFFISDNGHSYLIDRTMQVRLVQQAPSLKEKGTILDVEVCATNVFAFDIMFHRGQDLRDRQDMDLLARLDLLRSVVETVQEENGESRASTRNHRNPRNSLFVKKHYLTDEFTTVFKRWKEGVFEDTIPRDGFIFTPLSDPYPSKTKWGNLLKWKPAEMNSIDFLLADPVEAPTGTTYSLMVGDKEIRNVPFEPCPKLHINRENPIWGSLRSGMVLECTYNNNNGVLPWRPREDKQKPNYRHVALDVWKSMHEPVHIEDFAHSALQDLRDFHNRVKDVVVHKATSLASQSQMAQETVFDQDDDEEWDSCSYPQERTSLRVLDLACGRGGDLHKWRKVSTDQVEFYGVDISSELLAEAQTRATEVASKHSHFIPTFSQGDLRNEQQVSTVRRQLGVTNSSIDIASCQFALHYFYETERAFDVFIGLVYDTLRDGGVFIASLFDAYRVYDLCCRGDNDQQVQGTGFTIIPQFDVRMGLSHIKSKEFGIPVSVSISGDEDVILKRATVEYLVFPDQFIRRMRTHGFHLQESRLFLDVDVGSKVQTGLSKVESAYSDLHRYYVFTCEKPVTPAATAWSSYRDVESVDGIIFKDGSDPATIPKLFVASLGSNLHWLATYLELVTGRPPLSNEVVEEVNDKHQEMLTRFSEHFNVFLSIVEDTDAGCVVPVDSFKPSIYLEDVKHIYVLRRLCEPHSTQFFIVARECADTKHRLLWFPSFVTEAQSDAEEELQGVTKPVAEEKEKEKATTANCLSPPTTASAIFQGKFTIRDLRDLAEHRKVQIPTNIKKKADIVAFLGTRGLLV